MTDVTFKRKDFESCEGKWKLVGDVVAGQDAIKSAGDTYLPRPNPTDTSAENKARYEQYLARTVFYNVTGRTLQGLVGAAFRKEPSLEVEPSINYVEDDIDGAGVSIYQQSQMTLKSVLKLGRHALLADYPQTDRPASKADMNSGRIRATVVSLDADQVINWRVERVGAEYKLVLVVIKEAYEVVSDDGFGSEEKDQYRVLRLTDGIYTQEVWRKSSKQWSVEEGPTVIKDGSGSNWDEIPLTFVGSMNNDAAIDDAPLYDLASINVAHYRNSADYEDSAYFTGQAQPWMSGLTVEWRDWLETQGIYIGSRSPILLPEGGQFGIASASPNTLVKEAMDQKENQMIALGARLVTPGTSVKTATEAQGDNETEHSVLSLAVSNVNEAYIKCLEWISRFMNVSGAANYEINTDFIEHKLDPQMLTALIQSWQSGRLPESDLWSQLRKYGVIDPAKTDDEIKGELESASVGLGLDDGDE
jgi:hypothetical protein